MTVGNTTFGTMPSRSCEVCGASRGLGSARAPWWCPRLAAGPDGPDPDRLRRRRHPARPAPHSRGGRPVRLPRPGRSGCRLVLRHNPAGASMILPVMVPRIPASWCPRPEARRPDLVTALNATLNEAMPRTAVGCSPSVVGADLAGYSWSVWASVRVAGTGSWLGGDGRPVWLVSRVAPAASLRV